jgi:hypothetical protein
MGFWGHVPNSLTNKNMESNIPYPLRKLLFGASEGLLYPSGIGEKIFSVNFECYDLANSEE